MSDTTPVPDGSNGKAPEAIKPVDDRGVPWENRAKEFERKFAETQGKLEQVTAYLQNMEAERNRHRGPTEDEVRTAKLQELAKDPESFVEQAVEQRLVKQEVVSAAEWVRSQEDYKPEIEVELVRIMQEHNLGGRPLQKAKTAMKILQMEKPDLFPKSKQVRDRELNQYRSEGQGRVAPPAPTESKDELLQKLAKARNSREQAELLNKITYLDRIKRSR